MLSDPERRRTYDRFGHEGLRRGGWSPRAAGLRQLPGHLRGVLRRRPVRRLRPRGPAAGGDIGAVVEIELAEVLEGAKREVTFEAVSVCEHCRGNGAEPGTPIDDLRDAARAPGQIRQVTQQRLRPGGPGDALRPLRRRRQDPREALRASATAPAGSPTTRTWEVDVPAGIEDGQRIRIAGAGHAGDAGGRQGDLYVEVRDRRRRALRPPGDRAGQPGRGAGDDRDARRRDRPCRRSRARRRVEVPAGHPARRRRRCSRARGCRRCAAASAATSTSSSSSSSRPSSADEQRELPSARRAPRRRARASDRDPARGSLRARVRRARARQPARARPERGRGGAGPGLGRVRDLRPAGRGAGRWASSRPPRAAAWSRSPRPRSPTTGPTAGPTSTTRSRSAAGSGCAPPGGTPKDGLIDVVVDPGPRLRHRRPPDHAPLPGAAAGARGGGGGVGPARGLGNRLGRAGDRRRKAGLGADHRLRPRAGLPGGRGRQRRGQRGRAGDRARGRPRGPAAGGADRGRQPDRASSWSSAPAISARRTSFPRRLVCSGMLDRADRRGRRGLHAAAGLEVVERRIEGDWAALLLRSQSPA